MFEKNASNVIWHGINHKKYIFDQFMGRHIEVIGTLTNLLIGTLLFGRNPHILPRLPQYTLLNILSFHGNQETIVCHEGK